MATSYETEPMFSKVTPQINFALQFSKFPRPNLGNITPSKISQLQKDKYCIMIPLK